MRTLIVTFCCVLVSASTYAGTFADADFFGTIGEGGNPNGILLDAGGKSAVNTSFNFVSDDGTAGFTIGSPYSLSDQGTYSSALGYVPGTSIDASSLMFTFFFRDPTSGSERERINIGFGDLIFNGNSFSGTLVTQFGGNALLVGNIEADGFVNYRVRAMQGDFILDGALAQFTTVQEGGSAAGLLGIAFIAVELIRRKLRTA
jgi:hypothetical protein